MRKQSKLALADQLIIELTIKVADEITRRVKLAKKTRLYQEKKGRCACINVYGFCLSRLWQLQRAVHKLRVRRVLGSSPELMEVLQCHLRPTDWRWLPDKKNIGKRIDELTQS